jgi:putative transposase
MARPLRIEYEGALYHLTSRGNARERIFFTDSDREAFLGILGDVVERFGWLCHAYCLMTNHYHLLIETPNANLSRGMRHLNGVYTQWINRHNKRTGHIFQGRFKSVLVEKESHLLELARYVVLNPVRAKMVRSPRDWRWSSYRATSGQAEVPRFLTIGWILGQLDRDPSCAVRAYRRFVKQGRGVTIWDGLRRGNLLGTDAFIEDVAPLLNAQITAIEIPRCQRLAARPALETIFADVHDKASRNEQIYQAVRVHEYTLKEVAGFLGLYYSTISVIAKRVAEEKEHQK